MLIVLLFALTFLAAHALAGDPAMHLAIQKAYREGRKLDAVPGSFIIKLRPPSHATLAFGQLVRRDIPAGKLTGTNGLAWIVRDLSRYKPRELAGIRKHGVDRMAVVQDPTESWLNANAERWEPNRIAWLEAPRPTDATSPSPAPTALQETT